MIKLGEDMDYYGGMSEIGARGREMLGAGLIALNWADEMTPKNTTLTASAKTTTTPP